MDSTRLPGKALIELGGHPVLEWVIRRVKSSKKITKVVLATTTKSSDDSISELAAGLGIEVFRGAQDDVLGRFAGALERFPADVVIRVCADNPFVSGSEIDLLISDYMSNPVKYVFNHQPDGDCEYSDGFGAELFEAEVLRNLNKIVAEGEMREHLTLALKTLNSLDIRGVKARKEVSFPSLKFDLDTQSDFDNLATLIESFKIDFKTSAEEIISAQVINLLQSKLDLLFGLNRSLTGFANRETIDGLQDIVPIKIIEIPSGTKVFDWTVPQEWQLKDAYIEDASSNRIIDFKKSPIHVVSYSQSCDLNADYESIKDHIHVHETMSNAVPYRTSYYKPDWGFCVTHAQLSQLKKAKQPLHAVIESEFTDGSMTCGEIILKGKSVKEILISTYICHPAMANDSLSGVLLTSLLAKHIAAKSNRHWSYRIVFVPETVGAIAYLKLNEQQLKQIDFGLQITTVGGPGGFHLKKSFDAEHPINSIIEGVLKRNRKLYETKDFDIHGSDERQYSSPGFRINMATLAKDIYYTYPQYHTSLDNLDFVTGSQIADTFFLYAEIIDEIESRQVFVRTDPHGEPMLSPHGLYDIFGGALMPNSKIANLDLVLWILFLTDGKKSIQDIASHLEIEPAQILEVSQRLVSKNLLKSV
jgi:aminopeptidase-like protein/molybdopterin-guanine dinucleotide biosynthesis protein A